MRSKYWVLVAAGSIGLAASSAFAGHNEPIKGASLKGVFLTAYAPCVATNDTLTSSAPLGACHPAVRSNPACGFGAKGTGKFSASVKPPDIALAVSLSGLDAGCEGKTLGLAVELRGLTTDGCQSGDPGGCTVPDLVFPVFGATCVVAAGKCSIKTTVNTGLPGTLVNGNHAGITVGTIDIVEGATPTFRGGVLVP